MNGNITKYFDSVLQTSTSAILLYEEKKHSNAKIWHGTITKSTALIFVIFVIINCHRLWKHNFVHGLADVLEI